MGISGCRSTRIWWVSRVPFDQAWREALGGPWFPTIAQLRNIADKGERDSRGHTLAGLLLVHVVKRCDPNSLGAPDLDALDLLTEGESSIVGHEVVAAEADGCGQVDAIGSP
jgi:hypothetical protein